MKKAANFRGKNFFLAHGTADGEIKVFKAPFFEVLHYNYQA